MKKILVIGSFMTDLVVKADRFVEEGETIIGNSFNQFTGGKGANQAIAAARLGSNVEMIGELGKDSFGKDQIQSLENNNVKHDHVLFTGKAKSGVGNPQVDASGNNRIVVVPGANLKLTPKNLEELSNTIQSADIIVLQLEIPFETVYKAIELGHKYHKQIILNPAPAADLNQDYASMVTYMTPNEHEAQMLTGIDTSTPDGIKKSASELLKQGYQNVIITIGDKGSYFVNKNVEIQISAYKVKAVDSTAAGDAFIGAFAYGLSRGNSIQDSLQYASAVSAIAVTKMGAQPSLPSKKEVDDFLKNN
ncbi:ribokinase [Lactobacillus halodurans]|uniref:Deoxyribokinase n=1 Tax=Companilactobacillus halodurans TaxID=2584183 RepID=A0A5P0ZR32_9LACO|nr:ribokinase [Companilactobacillus halodurans]MQS98431.1 ribokinase [Companilactobacillus halodurans]